MAATHCSRFHVTSYLRYIQSILQSRTLDMEMEIVQLTAIPLQINYRKAQWRCETMPRVAVVTTRCFARNSIMRCAAGWEEIAKLFMEILITIGRY